LLIVVAGACRAAPVFSIRFAQPTGTVGPYDTIPVWIVITNLSSVDIIGGELQGWGWSYSGDGWAASGFWPHYISNEYDWAWVNVPANSEFSWPALVFEPYVPPVPLGTYTMDSATLTLYTYHEGFSSSTASFFQRTVVQQPSVPEPSTAWLLGAGLLCTLLGRVRRRAAPPYGGTL
jgi:hypothetical protein